MKAAISIITVIAILLGVAYYNNNELALTKGEYRKTVEYQNAQIDSLKTMMRSANIKLDSLQSEVKRISANTDSIRGKADMILHYQKQEAERQNNVKLKLW